jgi:hypothetical protein
MPDYRSMYDREYLGEWDLAGKDITVTIREVKGAELTAQGGRKSKKPVVYFEGKEKGLALNKTNGKIIAGMYGTKTEDWVGKRITLYPAMTTFGADTVPCIRVRPEVPHA